MAEPLRSEPAEASRKGEDIMSRSFPLLPFAFLLLFGCATANPAAPADDVDPVTEPTLIGAVDEAVFQGTEKGEEGARIGRQVGTAVGVFAAVFGGSNGESVGHALDRFFETREFFETTGAVIGTTKGMVEGAKRGYELDLQFAELCANGAIDVTRPYPDEIQVRFGASPNDDVLEAVAFTLVGRENRTIDIEGADDTALAMRDALIAHGVATPSLNAFRNDERDDIVMRIRYRG